MPALNSPRGFEAIGREIRIKTNVPADKPRYDVEEYRVVHGDSVFAIAESFKLKPETILWANYDTLQDSPDSLRPGQILKIPPTDGIYYQWKENDTLETVATEFKASVDDILNYPGNNIDLTNPKVDSGSWVMVPGGQREFVQWLVPTIAKGASGTSPTNQSSCGGGAVGGGGFVWPLIIISSPATIIGLVIWVLILLRAQALRSMRRIAVSLPWRRVATTMGMAT